MEYIFGKTKAAEGYGAQLVAPATTQLALVTFASSGKSTRSFLLENLDLKIKRALTSSFHSEQPPAEGESAPVGEINDGDISTNWDEAIETFDGMDLPEELLRGIYSYGFEKPSAIQQRAIRPSILGRDLIAQAQSGTVSLDTLLFAAAASSRWRKDEPQIITSSFESEQSHPRRV